MESTADEMSGTIAVFSQINRLLQCLRVKMPSLRFHQVNPDSKHALEELQKAHILITDYNLLAPIMYDLPSLKWAQGTWAGAEVLIEQFNPTKPLPYIITRFSGDYFGSMMGEYVVAAIVNQERNMEAMMNNRRCGVWLRESQFQLTINDHRGVCDLTIGILGMGAIGNEIAKILKILKATVWGLVRTIPTEDKKNLYVDKYFSLNSECDDKKNELKEMLRGCDYIINILPSTSQTIGLLNGDILQHCQERNAVFINIGRGTVISEKDLVCALEKKWLSAAILDVFKVEPLPQSSALWKLPQVMITPHVAGVTKAEYVADLFEINYKKFQAGKPLDFTLDLQKGY